MADDQLGPVDQNPDEVRDAACRLVESNDVCRPPQPPASIASPNGESADSGFAGGLLNVGLWVLLVAAVLAIVYVAVRYINEHRGSRSADIDEGDEVDPDIEGLVGTVVIDGSREPHRWRDEAEVHRRAGRYRDALRCRYRALVGDLARRGLLDEIPGRTTGEERRQLRASAPDAVALFREGADLFDGAWYGHLAVTAAEDDRFREIDGDVLVLAPALADRVPRAYADGRS